jgi:23S rRNA (uracil1939-C5)-methyltransferase
MIVSGEDMNVGEKIELTFEDLALGGEAVARTADGMVVFVYGGVPGDRGLVEITKRKPRFAVGKLVELLEPSSLRITPRCEYFGRCGGCKWQYLDYQDQLRFKQQQVADTLARIGKLQDVSVNEIIGMESPWYYRNKMEFTFGWDENKGVILGQHVAGKWDERIDLDTCYLQSERSVDIFALCRDYARRYELSVFSTETGEGLLRHVIIREGKHTGDTMVNIVTSGEYFPHLDRFVRYLITGYPLITGIILTINRLRGQSSQGQEQHLLFGEPTITETINDLSFEISAKSFFQTNTTQTERLYQIIQRMAGDNKEGIAVDLYCGAGSIALHLAPQFNMVYGVELVKESISNAEQNAERNNITNVRFLCGEVQKILPDLLQTAPDLIVVDPPRSGLAKKVVRKILNVSPHQIMYVSCNPATLARDLSLLTKGGYAVLEVQPIDMFPHTYHIETIVNLKSNV